MPGIVPALTHFDKPLRVPLGEISPLAAIGDHIEKTFMPVNAQIFPPPGYG